MPFVITPPQCTDLSTLFTTSPITTSTTLVSGPMPTFGNGAPAYVATTLTPGIAYQLNAQGNLTAVAAFTSALRLRAHA
jgi:hypothetical protein